MQEKDKNYFVFLGVKCIKHTFKDFLGQLDDLLVRGEIAEEDHDVIRNRILDTGNNMSRLFEDQGNNYYEINKDDVSRISSEKLIEELVKRGYNLDNS